MMSVTCGGGSGIYVLTYKGQRLAYLRNDPDEQITLISKSAPMGPSKFIVYEIDNHGLWVTLGTSGDKLLQGLRDAIAHGDLTLSRIIKNPSGVICTYIYDLTGCAIAQLVEEVEILPGGGIEIGRRIQFTPAPAATGAVTVGPHEKLEPELKPPDISAPIYALRTFDLKGGRLKSLYKEFWWDEGKAIATCPKHDPKLFLPGKEHDIPASGCSCGLYGLQSLDRLVREYGRECQRCVAVFAAEGRTIVGDRGLKTKAARVVAYWVQTLTELEVMEKQVPKAKHYEDIAKMLEDFHFPAWGTVEPEELFGRRVLGVRGIHTLWKYTGEERIEPKPVEQPRDAVRRLRTGAATGVVVANFKFTVADVQNQMGPAATPGGLAAIQHVHDIATGKKTS